MTDLDLDFVRSQFPAFSEPSLEGWAFLENAGGSYPCRQTIDRLCGFYQRTKVQPHGPYPASAEAGRAMDDAYVRLAASMNVDTDEVHIGPSTSQNTYVLARAFGSLLDDGDGDEIVVTDQDHEANSGVWRRLADNGATVHEWAVDPDTGTLDPADLLPLLNERTRLVSFPHCSNIVGHINPVAEITRSVHAVGAIAVVDGVSAAPHGLPDVSALGADIYLFSAYKTYGPHQGVMVVRRDVADRLPNQGHWFNEGSLRKHLTPAGPDHAQIAACNGMVDYVDLLHEHHFDDGAPAAERGRRVHELMRSHEIQLAGPLLDFLRSRSDVRILGPTDPDVRVPTIAFVPRRDPAAVAADLADHRVMATSGHCYAYRLIEAMGQPADPGVVRLSCVHYTSPAEIEQTIAALETVL